MSHLMSSILWVIFLKKMLNSLSLFSKSSILWVILKQKNWVILKKRFNSLSQIQKKKKFNPWSQTQKKGSILWVILEHKKSWTLGVILQKDFNSLSHIEKRFIKRGSNSMSHFKRVQFFESFFWHKVQFFESYKKRINSLRRKKVQSFESKKNQFFEKYWKNIQFFEFFFFWKKKLNSLSHILKKFNSESHTKKKNQFCESY